MFISLPYKELIYSLRGYSECFGESNLDNLKRLCSLAVQHKIILDYVNSNQATCRNYQRSFVIGIKESLSEFYDELNNLEDKKDHLVTLCAFHSLFKYEAFFTDFIGIIKQIDSISAIKLFEILIAKLKSTDPSICQSYKIIFFHYKKAFFEDLWNWLIYGYLNEESNQFFIVRSVDEEEIFKFEEDDSHKLDRNLLKRILMHGKLIHLFDLNYKISWKEIFSNSLDKLSKAYFELCSAKEYREIQLVDFIRNVTDVLFKFYSIHLIEKQNILNHLKLIKDMHLMGNHSFWMNFCLDLGKRIETKKSNIDTELSLKDVNNCWLKNIRQYYNEDQVNQFLNQVHIDRVANSPENARTLDKYGKFDQNSKVFFFPEISISYTFPAMIRLFLCSDTFKKYDVLFNFLIKLHQTRMILNKLWFENMKNRNYDQRICVITMKLTSLIEKFLFHYKVYIIEIAYCEFENEVRNCDNPSDLEECHIKFIDRLLNESLVNIDGVRNQFLDLFAFCQKVYFTNQHTISNKQYYDLQLDLNDLNSHFQLLFSNVKAHERSSSLRYLLN